MGSRCNNLVARHCRSSTRRTALQHPHHLPQLGLSAGVAGIIEAFAETVEIEVVAIAATAEVDIETMEKVVATGDSSSLVGHTAAAAGCLMSAR